LLLDRSYRTGLEIQLNRCAGFELFSVKFVNHEAVANGRAVWTYGADAGWLVSREGIKKTRRSGALQRVLKDTESDWCLWKHGFV